MSRAGRVLLESLRLDFDPEEAVRERAEAALALGAGGFIVFGGERDQVAGLVDELRSRVRRPLWVAADLERGAGQQFAGLPTLPPPAGLAAHPEPEEAARLAGEITARGARSVGVDLVFAPVVDLDVEPDNPIVGTRSFGHDPVTVARLAAAWIEACQEEGVVACAKHFPGHGRTTADSHEEIPVVPTPRDELEADLLPFRRLAGRVGAILTAHVAYPQLEVRGPATLSRPLLTDLLRGELGFEGLVVTDAMNMSGFLDAEDDGDDWEGGATEAATADGAPGPGAADRAELRDPAVRALLAGCDLLLYPADLAETIDVLDRAAARDERVAARLAEAVERSEAVRRRVLGRTLPWQSGGRRRGGRPGPGARASRAGRGGGGGDVDRPDRPVQPRPSDDPGQPGPPEFPGPDALQAAAISLLAIQRVGTLPDWLRAGRPLRVVAIWDDRELQGRSEFGARFVEELREHGWQAAIADPREPERIPSIVLVASTPQAWKGTAGLTDDGLMRVGHALGNPSGAYPVVFGHRRLLDDLAESGICAWGTEPALELFAARKLVADVEARRAGSGRGADADTPA